MSNSNASMSNIQLNDLADQIYLDENFISLINSINNEKFTILFTYFIENYNSITSQTDLNDFIKVLNSEIKSDITFNNFYRQIKFLINKGVYLRLSKKFIVDLINLGINEEKVNIIRDLEKAHLDTLIELITKSQNESNNNYITGINKIIDVEIKTEMPAYNTDYETFKYEGGELKNNNDIKKENLYLNFKLDKKNCGEFDSTSKIKIIENSFEDFNEGFGLFQNFGIKLNKVQLASFYSEIEKIQENLDKLC